MTSCCPRRRMRWSGATGAIARCKNRSTGYVRKPRSAHAWHSTCGEKPKEQGATKPSTPYMRPVLPKATRYPRYSLHKFFYILSNCCPLLLLGRVSRKCGKTSIHVLRGASYRKAG